MGKKRNNIISYHVVVLIILLLLSCIEMLPLIILYFKPEGYNFGQTSLGSFILYLNNKLYSGYVSWLAFMFLTIYISVLIYRYNNLPILFKVAIIFIVIALNFVFMFPLLIMFNLILSLFCDNPPMNIDKNLFFPYSRVFENKANFETIKNEILTYMNNVQLPCIHDVIPDIRIGVGNDDKCWRFMIIKQAGSVVDKYRHYFPMLYKLIENNEISQVIISSLDANTHIPEHRGYFKGYLRYHIGIDVPTDRAPYIICGGQRYEWKTGEGILFDDMFLHYVVNPSRYPRTVLYMDIKRQNLPYMLQKINDLMCMSVNNNIFLKLFTRDQHEIQKI